MRRRKPQRELGQIGRVVARRRVAGARMRVDAGLSARPALSRKPPFRTGPHPQSAFGRNAPVSVVQPTIAATSKRTVWSRNGRRKKSFAGSLRIANILRAAQALAELIAACGD